MSIISFRPAAPVLLLGLATLAACSNDSADMAEHSPDPVAVSVTSAALVDDSEPIEAFGTVQPAHQSLVSSRVMGPVVSVRVVAGANVAKGALLVEIQPESSEGHLTQAEGALAQAEAALALSERNLRRYKALHVEKAISDAELDVARMQYRQAVGAVEQAMGAVQTAETVASDAAVTAPFRGTVVERLVDIGDMAAPGRPLVRLESLEGRRLWLTVREADRHRVEIGQAIPVTLDSRPDLGVVTGTVAEIGPSADPATHTFTAKIDLGETDVASGVTGRAQLPGDAVERIVVPAGAVHQRGGLELVVVRAEDGTARTRAVRTGAVLQDGRIEVLSGVKAGDAVVVDAPGPVADGTPLEVRS
jgi:RND family efflux transporter MFP subunit